MPYSACAIMTPKEARMKNERVLAYGLIALGTVLLLTRLGGADWLWLALLGALFLFGYSTRKNYGFLVAGGVLMGVAVGTFIGTQSGMLLSLAVGFFAIDRAEPRPNRWALYAAGIFGVLGGLRALSVTGILGSAGLALLLLAAGVYLLYRDRQEPPASREYPPYTPPVPAPEPTPQSTTQPSPQPTAQSTPQSSPQPPPQQAEPTLQPSQPPTVQVSPRTPETSTETGPETGVSVEAAEPPAPAVPAAPELSPEAEARLRRLEAWRKETARAEGTPAYLVFSNSTLAQIAAARPRTLDDLAAVKGVGPVKLERYGSAVLTLLNES